MPPLSTLPVLNLRLELEWYKKGFIKPMRCTNLFLKGKCHDPEDPGWTQMGIQIPVSEMLTCIKMPSNYEFFTAWFCI